MKIILRIYTAALLLSLAAAIVVPDQHKRAALQAQRRQMQRKPVYARPQAHNQQRRVAPMRRQLRTSAVHRPMPHSRRAQDDGNFSLDESAPADIDYSTVMEGFDKGDNPYGERDVEQAEDDDGFNDPDGKPNVGTDGAVNRGIPWFGAQHPVYKVSFEDTSETQHMQNFKRISADLKTYEDEYLDCIKAIPDDKYSQNRIDECLGPNFIKVMLDIKYETMRVISKADARVKYFFLHNCYEKAGTDEKYAKACDLFESDVLDLMWNGFDFVKLTELNRRKYTYDYATMDVMEFKTILSLLEPVRNEFFELFNEIFAHKQVTLLRIKTLIDDRTKIIVAEAKRNPSIIQPKIISHNIEIEETVDGPDFDAYKNLPKQQIGGQDPTKFAVDEHTAYDRKLGGTKTKDVPNEQRLLNHGDDYHGLNAFARPPTVNRYEVVKRTNRGIDGGFAKRVMAGQTRFLSVHGGGFRQAALRKRGSA